MLDDWQYWRCGMLGDAACSETRQANMTMCDSLCVRRVDGAVHGTSTAPPHPHSDISGHRGPARTPVSPVSRISTPRRQGRGGGASGCASSGLLRLSDAPALVCGGVLLSRATSRHIRWSCRLAWVCPAAALSALVRCHHARSAAARRPTPPPRASRSLAAGASRPPDPS